MENFLLCLTISVRLLTVTLNFLDYFVIFIKSLFGDLLYFGLYAIMFLLMLHEN